MAGRLFGGGGASPGRWVTSIPMGATPSQLPSAAVLEGIDDERALRKLRRRIWFWRLFRRVR